MSSRRVVILVASIGVALLAGVGLLTYVNGSGSTGGSGGGDTATAYVATSGIAEDSLGQSVADSIKQVEVDAGIIPPGAIQDQEQLDRLEGLVAASNVSQGQFILAQMFVEPNSKSSSETAAKQLIDPQNTLISFAVNEQNGVSGLVEPGDYVNLYVKDRTENVEDIDANGQPITLAATDEPFNFAFGLPLYQKARVAAVGEDLGRAVNSPDLTDDQIEQYRVVTVEVSQQAAQWIVTAGDLDEDTTIWVSLVDPAYEPEEPLTEEDLRSLDEALIPYPQDIATVTQEG